MKKSMHILPQEIEVWYIIPAIRRDISKILINDYKISFEKTGNILGISKAAVSQYLIRKKGLHCMKCGKIVDRELHDCKDLPYKPVLIKVG